MARRLPRKSSEWIDRSTNKIQIRKQRNNGFKGDSITSA